MSRLKTTNRLTRYLAEDEAQRWGVAAAIFNECVNPYPVGSELAAIWQAAFNNQLAVIADHAAYAATQAGKLAALESELDARDVQPVGMWQRFVNWITGSQPVGGK